MLPRFAYIKKKFKVKKQNFFCSRIISNNKVLLRERKRHTVHRVVSTPYVVLIGYPSRPDLAGGGTLPGGGGTAPGYPPGRVPPILTWPGGTLPGYPPRQGTPPRQSTPPGRVPPWQGTPPSWTWQGNPPPPRCLPHGILGNVAKHYGIWVPPLGVNKLTK